MIRLTQSVEECKKYNLDSVRYVMSGAAPLGEETVRRMNQIWPKWRVGQGYGESPMAQAAAPSITKVWLTYSTP